MNKESEKIHVRSSDKMKLFICGSRAITNKEWIFSKIEECITENNFQDITILEGKAKGVDLIAKEWAVLHGIPVKEYPPDVKHYLYNACHKRNEAMAKDCDFMLDLWDGESGGSLHDILMAEKYHKPYKVCLCSDKQYTKAVQFVLDNNKDIFRCSEDLRVVFPKYKEAVFQEFLKDELDPWWEEGHNPGSCFWVYPVRQSKDNTPDCWAGCYCCIEDQVSIEEDIVFVYLYHQFLHRHFDTSIEYICGLRCNSLDDTKFEWYDYNLYSYASVRKIANEMKKFSEMKFLSQKATNFYKSLSDRLLLMMERNPDWDFITFEGP